MSDGIWGHIRVQWVCVRAAARAKLQAGKPTQERPTAKHRAFHSQKPCS